MPLDFELSQMSVITVYYSRHCSRKFMCVASPKCTENSVKEFFLLSPTEVEIEIPIKSAG